MRFGTWNVRSMHRAGSFRAVAEEISKYGLDLVGVQGVRWDGGGTESADEYTHNILNKWKNYFSQLLNVHRVSDVRQIEVYTAELSVLKSDPFDV
jgi:hypothetical protein